MQTSEKCNEIQKNVMRIDDLGNVHDLYILYILYTLQSRIK